MTSESKAQNVDKMFANISDSFLAMSEAQEERMKQRVNCLRDFCKNDKTAKRLFEYLSFSETNFQTNSAQFLKNQSGCDYYEVVRVLKTLDNLGVGDFIVGRKGKDSRISWKYNPKSIGDAALGSHTRLYPVPRKMAKYDGGGIDETVVKHVFRLRPDFNIEISLPEDFNSKDAERLSMFLKTIPFD